MLSRRIIGASAVLLAVTIGSAAAQQETSAGKPLQLLQFARHDAKAPLHPHARTVAKLAKHAEVRRHIAKRTVAKHHKMFAAIHSHAVHPHRMAEASAPAPEPAQPTPAAPQPGIWPAVDAGAPVAAALAAPAPPAAATLPTQPAATTQNVTTEQVLSDAPNDIAPNGRVPQAAAAATPNAAGAVADHHATGTETPVPNKNAASEIAAPAQSAAAAPVVRAMVATPSPAESDATSPVGSVSWMAQVLAALGGAVAAGAVAWFLILRRRREPQDAESLHDTLVPGE